MSDQNESTVEFISSHIPPLLDGEYSIELSHTLTLKSKASSTNTETDSETKNFVRKHYFAVCGSRFTLKPDEVCKVFPPANSNGDFDSILPHVVLTRRTLPWERTPVVDSAKVSSWLAVLTFSEQELPELQSGTLAELYPASVESGGLLPADKSIHSYGSAAIYIQTKFLGHGEKPSDPCIWFDVPKATFAALAPSLADLQWNAHARKKTTSSGTVTDYAVVVGTRLPPAGQNVTALLVSLENLGDQLPDDNGTITASWKSIRLVCLKRWRFRVGPLQASFEALLKGLNGGVTDISEVDTERNDSQLRFAAGYVPDAAPPNPAQAPFDAGYTVLSGVEGSSSGWYRGPFCPSIISPPAADTTWAGSWLPANQALDLAKTVSADPGTDVSYSAAFEIGRLIALADKNFATAQVAWKRDCRLRLNTMVNQSGSLQSDSRYAYAATMRAILQDSESINTYLGQGLTTDPEQEQALFLPQQLVDWLCKLVLLQSIPFTYLVPDAKMLPPESIRFFSVDPRWLASLLDGAWSLGRLPMSDWAFDATYQPWADIQAGSLLPSGSSGSTPCWPVFGLLLNSSVVSGYWPGIEFSTNNGATILREERLGPTTVLLLFDQTFSSLNIHEPPEGLHFGFNLSGDGALSKNLRYVEIEGSTYPKAEKPLPAVGTIANSAYFPAIPLRAPYVIQLDKLAGLLPAALGDATLKLSAADFALELVESTPSVTFTLPDLT